MYEDKTLVCKECCNEFVFTAGEQEFYAERGFQNEPLSCKVCRCLQSPLPRSWNISPRCVPLAAGEVEGSFELKSDCRLPQRVFAPEERSLIFRNYAYHERRRESDAVRFFFVGRNEAVPGGGVGREKDWNGNKRLK